MLSVTNETISSLLWDGISFTQQISRIQLKNSFIANHCTYPNLLLNFRFSLKGDAGAMNAKCLLDDNGGWFLSGTRLLTHLHSRSPSDDCPRLELAGTPCLSTEL